MRKLEKDDNLLQSAQQLEDDNSCIESIQLLSSFTAILTVGCCVSSSSSIILL